MPTSFRRERRASAGRLRLPLSRLRSGGAVSLCGAAQLHARRRTALLVLGAARPARLRARRAGAAFCLWPRQCGDARCADARAKPRLGGFRRGFDNINNVKQVATSPEIGWPTIPLYEHSGASVRIDTFDAAALYAYTNRDALTAKLLADLEAEYDDTGTISASDKAKAIKKLERELWVQRHVVEARFLQAREVGTKLLRPTRTPVPVLLGCKPFGGR